MVPTLARWSFAAENAEVKCASWRCVSVRNARAN